MRLAELQTQMFDALTSTADLSTLAPLVVDGALGAQARLDLYAEMYWLRLRDVLKEDFPLVQRVVGEEDFEVLAARYVRAHPSTHFSLAYFGDGFAASLAGCTPAWLPDLARLEWARAQAFLAEDSSVLEPAALRALRPATFARARVWATPSVQVLAAPHDVRAAWKALDTGAPVLAVEARATTLVVWRQGFDVFHGAVTPEEAEGLRRVLAGATLPEVCAAFAEAEAPAQAAFDALASWAREGMLARLDFDDAA